MTRWDVKIIEYKEIKLLKQTEKSTVILVHKKDREEVFIKKILRGKHNIYLTLQNCVHPYLPNLCEVIVSDQDIAS